MRKTANFIEKSWKYIDNIFKKYGFFGLFILTVIMLAAAYQMKAFFISQGMPRIFLDFLIRQIMTKVALVIPVDYSKPGVLILYV